MSMPHFPTPSTSMTPETPLHPARGLLAVMGAQRSSLGGADPRKDGREPPRQDSVASLLS